MNLYAIVTGLTGFFLLGQGLYVLWRGRNSRLHQLLCLICVSLSIWLVGYANMYAQTEMYRAIFWARIGFIGSTLIPILATHFTYNFLEKKFDLWLGILYLSVIPPLSLSWTSFIYAGVSKHAWGYYPIAGHYHFIVLIILFLSVLRSVQLLWVGLRRAKAAHEHRKFQQIKFFLVAIGIGSLGFIDYLVKYGIEVYPFGFIAALTFAFFVALTILRHQQPSVSQVAKHTIVATGMLAYVAGVFALSAFIVREILGPYGAGEIWIYGFSLFLIVFGLDRVRILLNEITEKNLLQKKYDYQKFLKDATRGISKIENLHHLLDLVIHFVTLKMGIRNAAILEKQKDGEYRLDFQRGYRKRFLDYQLPGEHPLLNFLRNEKLPLDIELVKHHLDNKHSKKTKQLPYDFTAIRQVMDELQTVCCIPSFLGRELRDVLLLGEKKFGDYYTDEDLNILYTLAQESAIAIENARLFDEARTKTKELERINEQLEYSKSLLMKALKETEVANKQLQDTQAQLIHEQKMATLGRLAASVGHEVNNPLTILSMNVSRAILKYRKNSDLKVSDIMELFTKMEQNIGRIKAVVNTLTGLLKRSEKGKFEPLSLKLILEETLPLVQFQTYLDNLTGTEVEFDIPGSIPLIRGDLERLQEVFLNLFINAYHAMTGKRNRKIQVTAEIDADDETKVAVHFTDNGCGMTEDVMKKIFNYGFTTKPPGKGSGMGLYMCKYIIELHGGDIKVKSKMGEGTTFTITLPIHEEASSETSDLRQEASS